MARKDRVESALREELATLIAREVKDPRVSAAGLIGVTRVECTQDLSVARVYVAIYADDAKAKKVLAGLEASAGFLRGPVGRRLNLQRPPELRFVRDESAELNLRLTSIVREDEAKAKAAGRVAGEAAPEPVAGAGTDPDSGAASDTGSESDSGSGSDSGSASGSASASGSGSDSGSGSESDSSSDSESGSAARPAVDPDLDAGSGPDPAPDVG